MDGEPKNGSSCPSEPGSCSLCLSQGTRLALPTLYGLMFVTGLPGNALSLWIFMTKIRTRTATHVYLVSLGASNVLLCVSMPLQAAYSALGDTWGTGHPGCKLAVSLVTPLVHVNIYVGMFTLMWIALSRCSVLVQHDYGGRPSNCTRVLPSAFLRRLRQARFAKATCAATWLFVLTCLFPVVIYYSISESGVDSGEQKQEEKCYSLAVEAGSKTSQNSAVAAATFFYVCFALVLLCYVSVARHFARSRNIARISEKAATYGRALRNIIVVQLVLTVCLLPYHVFKLVFVSLLRGPPPPRPTRDGCHPFSQLVEVKNVLLWLAVLRCCTDPVMYFLLDNTFRRFALAVFNISTGSSATQSLGSTMPAAPMSSQATKAVQSHAGQWPQDSAQL